MTQRWIETPPEYVIMVGWDRPLQHYFITVFDAQDEDTVVYTSMEEPSASPGGGLPWPVVLRKFEEFAGAPLPEIVRALLREDRLRTTARESNVVSRHRLDGAPLPPDLRPADPATEDPFTDEEDPPEPGLE